MDRVHFSAITPKFIYLFLSISHSLKRNKKSSPLKSQRYPGLMMSITICRWLTTVPHRWNSWLVGWLVDWLNGRIRVYQWLDCWLGWRLYVSCWLSFICHFPSRTLDRRIFLTFAFSIWFVPFAVVRLMTESDFLLFFEFYWWRLN